MAGVVLFILGAVGLALMVRGFAGGRVGGEPRCRKCLYDLSGIEGKAESCPECGASLSASKAIARGLRKRRLASILVGLLMMAVAGGFVGVNVWAKANDFDFNTIKPTWLLLRQVTTDGRWDNTPVAQELTARLAKGSLNYTTSEIFATLIIENEPDWLQNGRPTSRQTWGDVFIGTLVNPNTSPLARQQLSALAIHCLNREAEIGPIFEPPVLLYDLFDAMDHLLGTGQLNDQHAIAFLQKEVMPKISLVASSVDAERPIYAHLMFDWVPESKPFWGASGLNRLMFGNPWYSIPATQSGFMVVCTPVAVDGAIVTSTGETIYVSHVGEIEQDWAIPQNKARIERSRPSLWQSYRPPTEIDVAYLTRTSHSAPTELTFEVRITLLKIAPGRPGDYLDPDDSNISIVHTVVVPFEVAPEPQTEIVIPSPIR